MKLEKNPKYPRMLGKMYYDGAPFICKECGKEIDVRKELAIAVQPFKIVCEGCYAKMEKGEQNR